MWQWEGDEAMHPFWAVPRLSAEDVRRMNAANPEKKVDFNVELQEK